MCKSEDYLPLLPITNRMASRERKQQAGRELVIWPYDSPFWSISSNWTYCWCILIPWSIFLSSQKSVIAIVNDLHLLGWQYMISRSIDSCLQWNFEWHLGAAVKWSHDLRVEQEQPISDKDLYYFCHIAHSWKKLFLTFYLTVFWGNMLFLLSKRLILSEWKP